MSWLSNIFSDSANKLVDSVGNTLDRLVTSDEERLQAKNELQQIINAFEAKNIESLDQFEKEVTARHTNDMTSDSWAAKNIRPYSVGVTGISIIAMAFASIFAGLDKSQIQVVEVVFMPLVSMYGVMLTFYFGSRGAEKIIGIKQKK